MSVARRIAGLLDIAAEDASGAITLAHTKNRNSAYLCQQAKSTRPPGSWKGLEAMPRDDILI